MTMPSFCLPKNCARSVQTLGGSGVYFTDVLLKSFKPIPNHPNGCFYGPRATGENFRPAAGSSSRLHRSHVVAGRSVRCEFHVLPYRPWNPDIDCTELLAEHAKYQTIPAIGGVQHMCQDMEMGLKLGWGGILEKINHYRRAQPAVGRFLCRPGTCRSGDSGPDSPPRRRGAPLAAENEEMRQNLLEMAEMNEYLVSNPPRTFREACQWNLWYQSVARMYNSSGSLGRLDMILLPYYEADTKAGILTDEEAIFHIACHLVRDTAYIQLGGPDLAGKDATNPVSFLILEAAHRLKIPANIGVCVGKDVEPKLIRRGVEILMEDRIGVPKFLGVDNTDRGLCRQRIPRGTGARARLRRLPLAGHSGPRVRADGHRESESRRHFRSGPEGHAGGRDR